MAEPRDRLGDILVAHGAIKQAQLEVALRECAQQGVRLGKYLDNRAWASYGDIAKALSVQSGRPYVPPEFLLPDKERVLTFPEGVLRRLRSVPILGHEPNSYAVADPGELDVIVQLEQLTGNLISVVVCDEDAIDEAILEAQSGISLRARREVTGGDVVDKRHLRRVPACHHIGCVWWEGDDRPAADLPEGEVRDMNEEGALVIGRPPAPQAAIRLDIVSGKLGRDPICLSAEVQWANTEAGEFGLRWEPVTQLDGNRLKMLLLHAHQREAAARRRRSRRGGGKLHLEEGRPELDPEACRNFAPGKTRKPESESGSG